MDEITGTLLVFLILLILYAFKDANHKPKGYPPGPFLLPLVGYAPFVDPKNPMKAMRKLAKQYGEAVSFRLGVWDVVVLNSWDLAKEAFNHPNVQGRPNPVTVEFFNYGADLGLVLTKGSFWQQQKRHFMHFLRDVGFGRFTLENIVLGEVERTKKVFYEKSGEPLSLEALLGISVMNILWKIMADVELDVSNPSLVEVMNDINAAIDDVAVGSPRDFFPWFFKFLPECVSGLDHIRRLREHLFGFSNKLIEDHKASYDPSTMRDFIDTYLKQIKEDKENSVKNSSFSDHQLSCLMLELFVAGLDTTSSALNFIFLSLILNPDIQQRLQQDVLELTKGKRDVILNDKPALPYVEAFIMEVYRTCNIVPISVPHRTTADTNIGKYTIPKNTIVMAQSQYIHQDPNYWSEPEKFEPKRFLNDDGSVKKKINAYLPFSIGKRPCVGENIVYTILFLFVANMIQTFTLSSPSGVTPPPSHRGSGTVVYHAVPYELVATPH